MCLKINPNSQTKTKALRRKRKPILAYKVVKPGLYSEFNRHRWLDGPNISSRQDRKLTMKEIRSHDISIGFHFFSHSHDAIFYIKTSECFDAKMQGWRNKLDYRIVECLLEPKDIVATGLWLYSLYHPPVESVVATEAIAITKMMLVNSLPEVY